MNKLDNELLFGYKEVVLYYEQKVKNSPHGFYFKRSRLQNYLNDKKRTITLKDNLDNTELLRKFKEYPVSFFCFSRTKTHSTIPSLLAHLRNSFAHGNFVIMPIEKHLYYCFTDIYFKGKKKGQISMKGQIPVKAFRKFILELKENQQK